MRIKGPRLNRSLQHEMNCLKWRRPLSPSGPAPRVFPGEISFISVCLSFIFAMQMRLFSHFYPPDPSPRSLTRRHADA